MPEAQSKPASLRVEQLSLARAAAQLGPISFTLPTAGCWWLTGASGAGKSLLLESLAGFHAEAQGSILVSGKDVADFAPEYRSIALMPQRWRLFPHWTVARNLQFAAKLGATPASRIEELAERLQLAPLLNRPTRALSGGETQRIALAQTLLTSAKILLLDEPLSAIDAALQLIVLDLLLEESATKQRICIIAVHKPAQAYSMQGALSLEKGNLRSNYETA